MALLALPGCTKSGADAGAAPPPRQKESRRAKPIAKTARSPKPSATAEESQTVAASKSPAAPERIVRPTFPVPHHDDRRLADVGIRRYESKHLILYTDIDPELAQPLPSLMDQLYAAWEDYFGPLPPDAEGNDFQMIGCIMADRALFREMGLMKDEIQIALHGISRNQLFWMNDQPADYSRRHLMLHEGTHCFMTAFPNPTNQFVWYMEGMADLFRSHVTDESGRTTFRVFPRDRESSEGLGWLKLIDQDVRSSGPKAIEAVTGQRPADYFKYNAYAWSWALCVFLDGHPRYRDRFRRIGSLVTSRSDATLELQQVFQSDWNDLAEEWLVFAGNVCYGYDIERTVLDLHPGKPLSQAGGRATVDIAADRGWQSSGIEVERGKTYEIKASGRCVVATEPKPWESEPQGISFRYHAGQPVGMLVAAIRSVPPPEKPPHTTMLEVLPVGRLLRLTPAISGTLYFRVNDFWNELADNSGSVQVTLEEANEKNPRKVDAQ